MFHIAWCTDKSKE